MGRDWSVIFFGEALFTFTQLERYGFMNPVCPFILFFNRPFSRFFHNIIELGAFLITGFWDSTSNLV